MLYQLEQGKVEQKILEDSYRFGTPLPPKIANAPELQVGLSLFLSAFFDLTSSRSIGMAEGAIRWETIHFYCEANGIVEEQREDMFFHIQAMDSAYLTLRADKMRKSKAEATPPTSRKKK